MLIQLFPYRPTEYNEYLNNIKKTFSSREIMEDYLSISKKVKSIISPEVELKLRNVNNQYYFYLYYENSSIISLQKIYSDLIEQLYSSFPNLNDNSGFIDTKRRNMVLVLGYYIRSA